MGIQRKRTQGDSRSRRSPARRRSYRWIVALIVGLAGCESRPSAMGVPKAESVYLTDTSPVEESWQLKVAFSDSGLVRAVLDAAHAARYKQLSDALPQRKLDGGLRVDFYDRDGNRTSVLTAKRAVIYDNTNDMEAFDDVRIVSNDSTRIETEYMKWSASEKKIRSDKFVTITKPAETLRGTGFESDQDLKNYRIFKASGEARVKE